MRKIPWGPIRSLLASFSFSDIKEIIGFADIDMSRLSHLEQRLSTGASKSQLLSAIDEQIGAMDDNALGAVASIVCEEMHRKNPDIISDLERVLSRVGWRFSGSDLLPIEIFDISELAEIPTNAHEDIQKAATRLRDGDLSGSLSSSCAALDAVTNSIYQEFGLGDPGSASFQERIRRSLNAIGAEQNLKQSLHEIGWNTSDIAALSGSFNGSLNQAAFVMQKLRSDMGDVHGTKPVISALIYDAIKWSLLLLRILATR